MVEVVAALIWDKDKFLICQRPANKACARQGIAIFIPKGSDEDATRQRSFYDKTYKYLKEIMGEEV